MRCPERDVAEHPGRVTRPAVLARQDLERRRIRAGEHVRFAGPGEPLDRRAVEADALGERPLDLGGRDRDGFEKTSTSVNQSGSWRQRHRCFIADDEAAVRETLHAEGIEFTERTALTVRMDNTPGPT